MQGPRRGCLTEQQILEIVNGWSDSEDDFGEECEEMDVYETVSVKKVAETEKANLEECDTETTEEVFEIDNMEIVFELGEPIPMLPTYDLQSLKDKAANFNWVKCEFTICDEDIKFKGNSELPLEVIQLDSLFSFFSYFFDAKLVKHVVNETNLFSTQKNVSKPTTFNKFDIYKYIGICVMASVTTNTNIRQYWNPVSGNTMIQNTMAINKFEKIRQCLHFNNNENTVPRENPTHDRLFKIRPFVDSIIKNFQKVPFQERLCVDEQICSTKIHSYMKQYMPAKPHKWGFKLFVLCDTTGFASNFEIYTGQENNDNLRLENGVDLGASSNVVLRLLRHIPSHQNFKCYFDNYYTSIPLIMELKRRGIFSLGTVRRNRIRNVLLPDDKLWKKEERGHSQQLVAEYDSEKIALVSWKDTKVVNLASNFVGEEPYHISERRDRKTGQINVRCPAIIKEYRNHMGGVDLLDSHLGRYKIKLKSRKWYMRIFYHLLDLTVCNAWLLYKRAKFQNKENKKLLNLQEFKTELAATLCKMGESSRIGRPSSDMNKIIENKRRKPTAAPIPPKDIRLDGLNHWPNWSSQRQRCKYPNCSSLSYCECEKCNLALCFNKDRNCFKMFHNN